MPPTLRKPKAKSQAGVFSYPVSIEQAATKEFVRQELRAGLEPIQRDIKWLRWVILALLTVMLGGFALLLTVMLYLHGDTKQEMNRRFTEQKADMNRRFTEQKADMDKRFDKIESLLQKR